MEGFSIPCSCGSGRDLVDCHGGRRGDAAQLRALDAAREAALEEPFLRPDCPWLAPIAAEVAQHWDDIVWANPVEEALDLLDEAERRRLVDAYAGRRPQQWREICARVDRAVAERVLVIGAIEAAMRDLLPPSPERLERVARAVEPTHAVGFVVRPQSVWSRADAEQALLPWRDGHHAVRSAHVERVRALAARLEEHLPFGGRPRTSELLRDGCRAVADDEAAAREAAVAALVAYAEEVVEQDDRRSPPVPGL